MAVQSKKTNHTSGKNSKYPKTRVKRGVTATKNQLEHELKLQLVRYCRIWRYPVASTIEYCKQQGHPISESFYHTLRNELKNQILQGKMFTQQALDNLQIEHGDSLELLNGMLDVVVKEIRDHSSTAIFNTIEEQDDNGKPTGNKSYVFNKNHNSNVLAKLITSATDLMEKRDNTILATPVIMDLVDELKKEDE